MQSVYMHYTAWCTMVNFLSPVVIIGRDFERCHADSSHRARLPSDRTCGIGRNAFSRNGEAVWWCLHTKPRQEKATARDLRMQEIVYYLPQVVKESRTPQGRKIQSVVPLFPGYVFINGDVNDRLTALRGHRLVNVLEVVDQESLARDLRQIHTMLSSGLTDLSGAGGARGREGPDRRRAR